jgi:phosphoribosylglycinamide formyltransferase 1
LNIAVFVSGRGSNFQAILDSPDLKNIIEVKAVFSDKLDCPAFQIAQSQSVPVYTLGTKPGCLSYEALSSKLKEVKTDLVVLAGFLKLIPADVIRDFEWRIINIHPALLPSFGGAGMYGKHVHTAVFNSSAKVSGATVHFVDSSFDTGKIIAQRCVDISDVNSPEEIASRVLKEEHKLLPFVIKKIAQNKVELKGGRVIISD